VSPPAQTEASRAPAEALADFLRRMRLGIEDGLPPMAAAQRASQELPKTLSEAVERISERLRGEYREDEWGFDEEFAEAVYPFFEFLYDVWWRVDAEGVRNVPAHGRALLVSNHAGSLFPFDASMILGAVMKEHPLPRWTRFMVLDWAFALPFVSTFMRRVGGVPASPHNAARLLVRFSPGMQGCRGPLSRHAGRDLTLSHPAPNGNRLGELVGAPPRTCE